MERRASGAETQLDGLLRLSSSDWFGTVMLSPAIAAFGKRHPKVIVELLTDARLYSLPRREVASLILGYETLRCLSGNTHKLSVNGQA